MIFKLLHQLSTKVRGTFQQTHSTTPFVGPPPGQAAGFTYVNCSDATFESLAFNVVAVKHCQTWPDVGPPSF